MWLPKLSEVVAQRSQDFVIGSGNTLALGLANGAGIVLPARKLSWQAEIDRSNPIDSILIFMYVSVDVAASTLGPDGYAGIVDNITFIRNGVGSAPKGGAPRGTVQVVNAKGVDLLALRHQTANLDRNTLTIVNAPVARTLYKVCYKLDLACDQVADPLRGYTLCPVHLDSANPKLSITLAAQTDIDTGANAFRTQVLSFEVHVIRRDMPPGRTAEIIDNGGFIETEIVSSEFPFTSSAPQKVVIDSPGEYAHLLLTLFNTATTRGDFTDVNNRNWQLIQQAKVRREFTLAQVESENDETRTHTGTVPFANSYLLDFLSDQEGAASSNLGSLLDANLETNNGQQTLLKFTGGAAVSKIRMLARRFTSPIGARRFAFN